MARSPLEKISIVAGAVSSLGAILTAVAGYSEALRKAITSLGAVPSPALYASAAVLGAIAAQAFYAGLSRKSRLAQPDLLFLDPDNPDHLKGRKEVIKAYSTAVSSRRLVFLEGESGAGKSALLRSGLLPELNTKPAYNDLLPVYINAYGEDDWVGGPGLEVARELLRVMKIQNIPIPDRINEQVFPGGIHDHQLCALLCFELQEGADSIFSVLKRACRRTILLIFDQFDDYQAEHRKRFIHPSGRWISPELLMKKNPFWLQVGKGIEEHSLHCLITLRKDASGGFASVGLQKGTLLFTLDRVRCTYIIALLKEMTRINKDGNEIIENPQLGWDDLQTRLVNELQFQKLVLPIQVQTVLRGLANLPYLSVGQLERIGGVPGLESEYIGDAMNEAVSLSGIRREKLMSLLIELTDGTEPASTKTRTASEKRLDEIVSEGIEPLETALRVFEQKGVILQRAQYREEKASTEKKWSLYHDYLARAVLNYKRLIEKEREALQEGQKAWNQAASFGSRWRSTLPLGMIMRIFWERSRRGLDLRGYGSYLTLSLGLRLIPVLLIFASAVLLWRLERDRSASMEADKILASISGSDISKGLNDGQLRFLWKLAGGRDRIKKRFIQQALMDKNIAASLANGEKDCFLHAATGLDSEPMMRRYLTEHSFSTLSAEAASDSQRVLAAEWCVMVASDGFGLPDPTTCAQHIVAAMGIAKDPENLSRLGRVLGGLGDKLPADKALEGARLIVEAIGKFQDLVRVYSLGQTLQGLGAKLPDDKADELAQLIVEAMGKTLDPYGLIILGQVLKGLGDKLLADKALEGARLIVEAMGKTVDSSNLFLLGQALVGLGDSLPADKADEGARLIVQAMGKTVDPSNLSRLGQVLVGLGDSLPADKADEGARLIIDSMGKTVNPTDLSSLGEVLKGLGDKLPADKALEGARLIVEAMGKTVDPGHLSRLGQVLVGLGDKLPADKADEGARLIVESMGKTVDPTDLSSLGEVLKGLGDKLPADKALEGARLIVEAMGKTVDPSNLSRLGQVLVGLGDSLPADKADEGARLIIDSMGKTVNPTVLSSLEEALVGLGDSLPADKADEGARLIVQAMGKTVDPSNLSRLGQVLVGLGDSLPADKADEGARLIVESMGKTVDPTDLSSLGEVLKGLGDKLPADKALEGARLIVEAMGKTVDPSNLSRLGQALGGLGDKLPVDKALEGARLIIDSMGKIGNSNGLASLGKTLGGLGGKLPADKALEGARLIVEAMGKIGNPYGLADLGEALVGLGDKLPADKALEGARLIVEAMGKTEGKGGFSELVDAIKEFEKHLPQTWLGGQSHVIQEKLLVGITNALKNPWADDKATGTLLAFGSRVVGVDFRTLHDFVSWAKRNRRTFDLDIDSPPLNPMAA